MRATQPPTHTKLVSDLRALLKPFAFDPAIKAILTACDSGNLTAAALAVNAAQRERRIRSHTLLMAVNGWVESVNAAGGA